MIRKRVRTTGLSHGSIMVSQMACAAAPARATLVLLEGSGLPPSGKMPALLIRT
jgi:poly(3-hydroxybutyrate) depolymerase